MVLQGPLMKMLHAEAAAVLPIEEDTAVCLGLQARIP